MTDIEKSTSDAVHTDADEAGVVEMIGFNPDDVQNLLGGAR